MSTFSQPLSQVLTPKKSNFVPALILAIGLLVAVSAAAYGYLESRRTERIVIAVRDVPYGHQIVAEDLGTIELPLHRPSQLAGITDPSGIIGQWAGRQIGPNDVVQPAMLLARPPDQPVYPSGQQLAKNMVPIPFSTATIGPLTYRDFVNIGFSDPQGDPILCQQAGGQLLDTGGPAPTAEINSPPASAPVSVGILGRPYACRMLQRVKVLHVDEGKSTVYLEVTPYQAHAIWSIQAAGLQLWGERYGSTSNPLPVLDRLDASQIRAELIAATVTDTLKLQPQSAEAPAPPGSSTLSGTTQPFSGPPAPVDLPGSGTIPGEPQSTAITGNN